MTDSHNFGIHIPGDTCKQTVVSFPPHLKTVATVP